jgi:hypothetical protein
MPDIFNHELHGAQNQCFRLLGCLACSSNRVARAKNIKTPKSKPIRFERAEREQIATPFDKTYGSRLERLERSAKVWESGGNVLTVDS